MIIWWPLIGFLQAQNHPSRDAPCSQKRAPKPTCGSQAPTCSFEDFADTLTSSLTSYLSWQAKLLFEGGREKGREKGREEEGREGVREKGGSEGGGRKIKEGRKAR